MQHQVNRLITDEQEAGDLALEDMKSGPTADPLRLIKKRRKLRRLAMVR